jgi:hypothetical protein
VRAAAAVLFSADESYVAIRLTAPLVLPARGALVGVPLWEHAELTDHERPLEHLGRPLAAARRAASARRQERGAALNEAIGVSTQFPQ